MTSIFGVSSLTPITPREGLKEQQARLEAFMLEANDRLKQADQKQAEAEAEAKRRNPGKEKVYAVLYQNGLPVGFLSKTGGYVTMTGGIFEDNPALHRSPKEAADWLEQNAKDIEVVRFDDEAEAPTYSQANVMICNTLAFLRKKNKITTTQPAEDPRPENLADAARYLRERMAAQTATQPAPAPAADPAETRWQRNMTWFKTDRSA